MVWYKFVTNHALSQFWTTEHQLSSNSSLLSSQIPPTPSQVLLMPNLLEVVLTSSAHIRQATSLPPTKHNPDYRPTVFKRSARLLANKSGVMSPGCGMIACAVVGVLAPECVPGVRPLGGDFLQRPVASL